MDGQLVGQLRMGRTPLEIDLPPMEEHPIDPIPVARAPTWDGTDGQATHDGSYLRAHSPTSTAIPTFASQNPPRRAGGKTRGQ